MLRRTASVLFLGALLVAQIATAATPKETAANRQIQMRTMALQAEAAAKAPMVPVTLSAIFAAVAGDLHELTAADGTVSMDSPVVFVSVIRKNADGTRSIMCVDSEAAAKRFLALQNDPTPTAAGSQEK